MNVVKALAVAAAFVLIWRMEYATLTRGGALRRDIVVFTVVTAISLAACLAATFDLPLSDAALWITRSSEWLLGLVSL